MCIIQNTLSVYCTYYNVTLERAVELRRSQKLRFTQGELAYLMGAVTSAALCLKDNGVVLGDYRLENLYLSPEGHLKVYLLGVAPENTHDCYYRVAAQHECLPEHILAPEQIESIKRL